MKKYGLILGAMTMAVFSLTACGNGNQSAEENKTQTEETKVQTEAQTNTQAEAGNSERTAAAADTKASQTVTIAAAASLETCLKDELIPLFESENPGTAIVGTYDSSGKLQTQIEEGAEVDLFFSAAEKQMNALSEQGMIGEGSVVRLLENKIVFIVPAGEEGMYSSFEDVAKAESIAIGDPESVPVGQYAKEALTNLGLWEEVLAKASLGTNVTEVLNWVAEGSAAAGIVYATDAAQTHKVSVVAEAPKDSVNKAIYPVGIVKDCGNPDGARLFLEFLQSDAAMDIFVKNGFAAAE